MEDWNDAFTPSSISRAGEVPVLGEAEGSICARLCDLLSKQREKSFPGQ